MSFDNFLEKFFRVVLILVILFLSTVTGFSAHASGAADYCYIEWYNPVDAVPSVRLMAHVPWRIDRKIAYFPTTDEAIALADKMKCSFK